MDYLNMLDRIYVFDGFAGWDPEVCPALLLFVGLSILRLDWTGTHATEAVHMHQLHC